MENSTSPEDFAKQFSTQSRKIILNNKYNTGKVPKFVKKRKHNASVKVIKYKFTNLTKTLIRDRGMEIGELVRIDDFIFPLDKKLMPYNGVFNVDFSQYQNQVFFKRILGIEHQITELNQEKWRYTQEERNPQNNPQKDYNTFIRVNKYLRFLEEKEAAALTKQLETWAIGHKGFGQKEQVEYTIMNQQTDVNSHIQPYFCFREEYPDVNVDTNKLKSFSHNRKMLEQIGLKNVFLDGEWEGFEVFFHVQSRNWILYLKRLLEFHLDESKNGIRIERNALHIKNFQGNQIPGHFKFYRKIYQLKKSLCHELYLIFYPDEQTTMF